jgi:uncharacterized protein YdbL (DUF1318 family)
MADFATCYSFLLPNEDETPPQYEIVADPTEADPNAQAISGINSHFWPADFAAIASLPQSERGPAVASFYQRRYWNQWLAGLISNRIAAMTLDASVNQGAGWGARFLQGACGATVDGALGPATVAAANMANLDSAIQQFIALREARYRQVGGPSLNGWLVRAAKIPLFQ